MVYSPVTGLRIITVTSSLLARFNASITLLGSVIPNLLVDNLLNVASYMWVNPPFTTMAWTFS